MKPPTTFIKRLVIPGSLLLLGALTGIAVGHRIARYLHTSAQYQITIKNCAITTATPDPSPYNGVDSVQWVVDSTDSATYLVSFAAAGTPINPLQYNAVPTVSPSLPDQPHPVSVTRCNHTVQTNCGYYRYKLIKTTSPGQNPVVTACPDPGIHVIPPDGFSFFFVRFWTWFEGD